MTDDLVLLSRLHDGDLPPDEAAALRARIAAEPALAAAWEALSALPATLSALPEASPPPALVDRVVASFAEAPATPQRALGWRSGLAGALVGLAAGLLFTLRPVAPDAVRLGLGAHEVAGELAVEAGGLHLRVDGRATVTVEPRPGLLREGGQEASMRQGVLGAAAGVLVTVGVIEGRVWLDGDDGTARAWEAGQRVRLPGAVASGRSSGEIVVPSDTEVPEAAAATVADLRAEVEALRQALALREEEAKAVEGAPSPWPDALPAPFRPEGVEAALREIVTAVPGLVYEGVDCAEYPCLALLRASEKPEGWEQALEAAANAAYARQGIEDVGLGLWGHWDRRDAGDVLFAGLAFVDPAHHDPEIARRSDWRMRGWFEALGEAEGSRASP